MTAITFALSLVLIVVASELFTNAVEWAGYRLKLGTGATGSLLAALGTSLPEATVPVVALIGNSGNSNAVAMGGVIGSPMLLLGVGMGITGLAVARRKSGDKLEVGTGHSRRDLGVFLFAFSVLILMALAQPAKGVRIAAGVGLVMVYALYVRKVLNADEPGAEMPEPLHLLRWDADREAGRFAISLQLILSVGLLIYASDLFVGAINSAASVLHMDALTVAVVLVPVATELPETMNSVLWVRSADDGLAFGNVAGSAVFQACLLGALGLCFTSWQVGSNGLLSMVVTLITAAALFALLWRGYARGRWLALALLPWTAYVAVEVATRGQL
jgi:cation:H+ antiporter